MTGKTLFVVCALVFVTLASADVAQRDARTKPEDFPFFNLFATAGDTWKIVQNNLFKVVGVKNEQQFNEYVAGEAKTYTTNLETLFKDIKKTADENVEKIENSGPVMHLRTTVNEAIVNLKKVDPVAAKTIDQFTTNTKHLMEGISDIGDSDAAKKIQDIGNKIMETAAETIKVTNNQIQESIKKV